VARLTGALAGLGEQRAQALQEVVGGAGALDAALQGASAGAAVGAGEREQGDVARGVAVGLEAGLVAVEVVLEEADAGQVGVKIAGDEGVVEGDAGLAPGGADVDDDEVAVGGGLLGDDGLGDAAAGGGLDELRRARGGRSASRGRAAGSAGRRGRCS
jgi:hypothetical protein